MNRDCDEVLELAGYSAIESLYFGSKTLVYRGIRQADHLPVILKRLRNANPTLEEQTRFQHQYTIVKDLEIPGLIKGLELVSNQNSAVLILEDVGGIALSEYLKQTYPLPIVEFLSIAVQLSEILQELHASKIIHKDIKPANILIHPQRRQIWLIDFSIATQFSDQHPHQLEGTLAYLSPEQTGRMNRSLDSRSDLYSLGITFYELLTGRVPFMGEDALEIVHSHLAKEPTPISDLRTDLPTAIAQIVTQLIAKNPDDRYQSASGLQVDLKRCLEEFKTTQTISDFEIGKLDHMAQLNFPTQLYGRESQLKTLFAAFERAKQGSCELVILGSVAGIGKTALIQTFAELATESHTHFISGKFDPFRRDLPFACLSEAYRDLIRQILTESQDAIEFWRDRFQTAVGQHGQSIINLIPELEALIGQQPALPELPSREAQHRIHHTFVRFLQAMTGAEFPLIEFMDDVQWVDATTIGTLPSFLQDSKSGYRLVLLAYRACEVNASHPLMQAMSQMQANGFKFEHLMLEPLLLHDVVQFVADTFCCHFAKVQPLAKLLYTRTEGNVFLLTQVLKSLHVAGLIWFNFEKGEWQWELQLIEQSFQVSDAIAKKQILATESPQYSPLPCASDSRLKSTYTSTSASSEVLDVSTILKAAEAIQSELVLDQLLDRLLHIMLENAGAQKGCIVLDRQGTLFIEAADRNQEESEVIVESIPLSDSQDFPLTVLQYVARTQSPIVSANAMTERLCSADPYVLRTCPKSLLCAPILYQGQFIGIVYLENNLVNGAFSCDRLELVQILMGQAAIAIENAKLYAREQERISQIEQSQQRLKLLIQQTPLAVIEWNTKCELQAWNPAAEAIFGYSVAEVLGRHFKFLIPEEYQDYVDETATEILKQAGGMRAINDNLRKDGQQITCEWFNAPLVDANGEVLGGVSMGLDISDRQRAEAALQQSQSQLESVTNNIPGAVYAYKIDAQGQCSFPFISNRSRDLFEVEPSLLQQQADIISHQIEPADSTEFQANMLTSMQTMQPFSWTGRINLPSGPQKWIEAKSIPERQADGSVIWNGVMLDVSDRKAAEILAEKKTQELEQALAQLQQSQAQVVQAEKMSALGNLVAGVAHEINNPIGFLNGSISNAQEFVQDLLKHLDLYEQYHANAAAPVQDHAEEIDLEFLREDLPKLLNSMTSAVERIKGISKSLRTFSRADTEQTVAANLHEGLESTLLILKYRLKANEFRSAIKIVKDFGDIPEIECFPGQLNQVFMNILANAIDMFDELAQHSKRLETQTIHIQTVLTNSNTVEIRIRDNGKGMSEEVKSRIFDQLFTTKAVGRGTGLGLAIAHQIIVEKHQGSVEVYSELGQGAEFVISLPVTHSI